jgi:hypothetical protein
MGKFTRGTLLAATKVLQNWSHSDIERFGLEFGVQDHLDGYSRANKANALSSYLLQVPSARHEEGGSLSDAVVRGIVERSLSNLHTSEPDLIDKRFPAEYAELHAALSKNGYVVQGGVLRTSLPEGLDLPEADDEVHALLKKYDFTVPLGHLDQAISAHSRGEWAGANSQLRSFIEGLFDSIVEELAGGTTLPPPGHQRRIWLANRTPPFFVPGLNEWDGQGKGFMEGFIRRLHPAGSHPGLSDEEDSTFRLHLVLLVARSLLRRL